MNLAGLRTLWGVTAFRLSVVYSLVFGLAAILLVYYVSYRTTEILRREVLVSIEQEVERLDAIYQAGGLNRLMRTLDARSRAPGANLYLVSDPTGRILAGNVESIASGVLDEPGWTPRPFRYVRFAGDRAREHFALAHVFEFDNGLRILVGRDIRDLEQLQKFIGQALRISLGAMVLLGIATWIFVGRRALKRIDLVSRSTSRILSGDLSERLPISGAGDEFDRLSARMNDMLARIALLDTGLGEVSDNIAHDLKTPLTRLRNKVEAALAGKRSAASDRKLFQEVIADSEQLISIFDSILMISRIETGSAVAQLSDIDLAAVVDDIVELYGPAVEEKGGQLRVDIKRPAFVSGNRELLSRAVANLLENAITHAAGEGGQKLAVNLSVRQENGVHIISIADSGLGIDEADLQRVQERFVRLEPSRNRPGTGLGLALVKAIAVFHGAELALLPANPGLLVEIRFPSHLPAKRLS